MKTRDRQISELDQSDTIEFLSSPAAFEGDTKSVDVITTHGAKVFLGKNRVYKMKQAVSYGYMDFTTLRKRREACEKEFELNRSVAPSVYLGVLPITLEQSGCLAVDGKGAVVEWCVYMCRFHEKYVLQRMAEDGNLTHGVARLLGKQIAEYHQELRPLKVLDDANWVQSVIDVLEPFFTNLKIELHSISHQEFLTDIKLALEKHSASIDARARRGSVRRCHGDLHLRNIVMLDNLPTPFDALEFSDDLATIDVLYDLAFLIMDLLHLGLQPQANIVLNRYVHFAWELIDQDGFLIMPLFLSLRSAIRCMVSIQRADRDITQCEKALANAEKFMDEAVEYLKPSQSVLVAVGGLSGTGKSTMASSLAPKVGLHYGALYLRSDLERKQMFGVEEYSTLPAEAYKLEVNKEVYDRLFEKAEATLQQGQPVVLDAVFARDEERQYGFELAQKLRIPFCGLWLHAPKEVLLKRVSKRANDASDADELVVEKQLSKYPDIECDLTKGWRCIDASGNPPATLRNAEHVVAQEIGQNY